VSNAAPHVHDASRVGEQIVRLRPRGPFEDRAILSRFNSLAAIIGRVLSPAVGREFLDCSARHDFVKQGLLVAGLAENATEALYVLAHAGGA
jgi:hypothetical protein